MPGEYEAEQAAHKVREELENQASRAAQRARETEAQAKAARDAVEARQIADGRAAEEAAAAARPRDFGRDYLGDEPGGDRIAGSAQHRPPLPPPDPGLVDQANAAQREAEAARAEVERIRGQIANLPPTEEILSEIDERTPEDSADGDEEIDERAVAAFAGSPGCFRILGAASAGLGALLLLFSLPSGPTLTTGNLPPLVSASASPTPTATATASPTPSQPTEITGEALALVDFRRTSGSCTSQFRTGFGVSANVGDLTLVQLGVNHESIGTLDLNGNWTTSGEGQMYRGRILGSRIFGMYSDESDCDYDFDGWLTRLLVDGPPFSTVPAFFEFLDPTGNLGGLGLLGVPPGVRFHVIVASDGDFDVRPHLPITVILSVDGVERWRFLIDGAPTEVCRGADGCSGDAPSEREAAWDNEDAKVLITAVGSDGTLLAAHAPHGLPAAALPGPSASPSATPSASASSGPSPTASAGPATPPGQTGGGNLNVPLAATGVVLIGGGLAAILGASRRGRRRGRGGRRGPGRRGLRRPPTSSMGTAAVTTSGSQDARRDEIESKARKLEEEAARLATELETQRQRELKPIDFGEAFTDTVNALGGGGTDSGPPGHWFESTEKEIARLRAEAAALRAQL